jgi:hypothetical protein
MHLEDRVGALFKEYEAEIEELIKDLHQLKDTKKNIEDFAISLDVEFISRRSVRLMFDINRLILENTRQELELQGVNDVPKCNHYYKFNFLAMESLLLNSALRSFSSIDLP